jgi:hypothetical protein
MHVCDQREHPGPRLYSLHGLLQFFDEGPMVVYGVDFPIIDEFSQMQCLCTRTATDIQDSWMGR